MLVKQATHIPGELVSASVYNSPARSHEETDTALLIKHK